MTDATPAAPDRTPFGVTFGPVDDRTPQQREADRASISAQVDEMLRTGSKKRTRARVLTAMGERRKDAADHLKFDVLPAPGGRDVLATRERLVMRASTLADEDVRARLRELHLDPDSAEPVPGLDGLLARIVVPGASTALLRHLVGRLATLGVEVELSHVADQQGKGEAKVVVKKTTGPATASTGAPAAPAAGPASPPAPAPSRRTVKVAVIDSGIARRPRTDGWLSGIAVTDDNVDRLDHLPEPNGFLDLGAGHGTFVAGVIQQVAPHADIAAVRALDTDGIGCAVDVAAAIVAAARDGAEVINLSFGVQTDGDRPPLPFVVALEILAGMDRDVVLVAAAGNFGNDRETWPAAFDSVLAVGGLTQRLAPAVWSTRGSWVDCSTIAEGVRSTFPEGTSDLAFDPEPDTYGPDAWAFWTGTSFAAPQVAGAIAHLAGTYGVAASVARDMLLAGCETIPGYGRKLEILAPV